MRAADLPLAHRQVAQMPCHPPRGAAQRATAAAPVTRPGPPRWTIEDGSTESGCIDVGSRAAGFIVSGIGAHEAGAGVADAPFPITTIMPVPASAPKAGCDTYIVPLASIPSEIGNINPVATSSEVVMPVIFTILPLPATA